MRMIRGGLCLLIAILAMTGLAVAQSTNGTISGRVLDSQGAAMPGVSVTVESPNLQGIRSAITSGNGDYQFPLLPAGTYTVAFDISGFERQQRTVAVAPAQSVPLDIELGISGLSELVTVTAPAAQALIKTAQVATSFKQELIANLPTNRDINAIMLLAPAVHATGPSGNFSTAGAMSFDNLFLVNGVTVNENLRGQAESLFIEDAIEETTVATAGISAEFGRFSGGVVNIVTKSGGNTFSGSLRDTLNNDNWRALVQKQPRDTFAADSTIDKVVPTYEYTLGGPVLRDRLWFFTAGRLQTQESNRQLVLTRIPYTNTDKSRRYEAKGTFSATANHRFQGAYTKITHDVLNDVQSQSTAADLNSLYDRSLPENLLTFNYSGILTHNLFVEAQYSERGLSFIGSGSKYTDLERGTLLIDPQGRRYGSPTFCGICSPETRDNREVFVKASYFLSTKRSGSHAFLFGYDDFNDERFANNHQSGSDYRILNAPAILQGQDLIPSFLTGTTLIRWQPIFVDSLGTNFVTRSAFVNDNWHLSDRLTTNLGIRWDKNNGRDSSGALVAKQSAFSPRVGVVWDPTGRQEWTVTASAAKYVSAILNSIADAASPAGNADTYTFVYNGPTINPNPNGALLPTGAALQQLFNWFNANGGVTLPLTGPTSVRGVTPIVSDSLRPPSVWEYAGGVNRQFGSRAAVRSDFVYRKFQDFYITRIDSSTGSVIDTRSYAPAGVQGKRYDLAVIENDSDGLLKRRYAGLTNQLQFRFSSEFDIGANYTLSRLWGNVDGENINNGPTASGVFSYPEYAQESWAFPEGDLSADQRHRARIWVNYGIPRVNGLSLNLIEALESGVPYSASNQNGTTFNGVDPQLYVSGTSYLTPPDGAATQYYFTARDAFRTEGQRRTDLAINYRRRITASGHAINLFVQGQIINLFNQAQLCGCGASVFARDGAVQNQYLDTTVTTNVTDSAYQKFNPFTTTPVEGVNWAKGPNFGAANSRFAYTSPRAFRLTFGLRF